MPAADLDQMPIRGECRRQFRLAWPVMLSSLNWTLLHLTDIYVVGLTGTREVAVFGASRTLTYVAIMVQIGALAGILVHASRADGAGDTRGTGDTLKAWCLRSRSGWRRRYHITSSPNRCSPA